MIFAAGLGTRLKPITDSIPKALLPIGGKTLLEWQLSKLREAGITEVVINIHHFGQQIIDFCHEHDDFGMQIAFSDEREALLETGGGLRHAQPLLLGEKAGGDDGVRSEATGQPSKAAEKEQVEPILVCNVDILSNIDIKALVAAHRAGDLATIVVSDRATQRYFLFAADGSLRGWTNIATGALRPKSLTAEEATTCKRLAFSGMQIVSPRIFEQMASYPEKFSITDFYLDALADHTIRAFVPADYRMMDIGKIDHLQEAERFAETL